MFLLQNTTSSNTINDDDNTADNPIEVDITGASEETVRKRKKNPRYGLTLMFIQMLMARTKFYVFIAKNHLLGIVTKEPVV